MAFIRERIIKGKDGVSKHYQILESFWQDGRSKKRVIENLGKQFSIEKALDEAERRGFGSILGSKPGVQPGVKKPVGRADIEVPGVKESEIEKPGVKESLPQLSPQGNLAREKKLMVKRIPGPASYDALPPPGEGECWDKRYWKRLTFELMERKIRGVDPGGIAGVLFPHFAHHGQVGLATATLTFDLLKDKLDRSVSPDQFVMEFQASDYQGIVSQIKRRGSQNGRAVLTENDVVKIRKGRGEGKTLKVLAEGFGMSVEAVWKIVHKVTWKGMSLESGGPGGFPDA